MRTLYGKTVLDKLGEVVDPKHTAVLVVDMHRSGHSDISCHGGDMDHPMVRDIAPRLAVAVERARAVGATVAWIRNVSGLEGPEGDDQGREFPDELNPLPGELVVRKTRSSAFVGTGLELMLRERGVLTTITTGIATEGCIDATAINADHLDFYSVVLEDCIASFNSELHESALAVLRYRCEVVPSTDVLAEWEQR